MSEPHSNILEATIPSRQAQVAEQQHATQGGGQVTLIDDELLAIDGEHDIETHTNETNEAPGRYKRRRLNSDDHNDQEDEELISVLERELNNNNRDHSPGGNESAADNRINRPAGSENDHRNRSTSSNDDAIEIGTEMEDVPFVTTNIATSTEGTSSSEPIDVEEQARLQQVVEIPDDSEDSLSSMKDSCPTPIQHKKASEYRCPICFDPPDAALMTPCGHIFCTECLFQMVNSSRGYRKHGHCALCRKDVKFKDVRMIIMRKKRIKKKI